MKDQFIQDLVNLHQSEINRLEGLIAIRRAKIQSLLDSSDSKSLEFRIRTLLKAGVSKTEIAEQLKISRVTLYRTIDDNWRLDNNRKVNARMKEFSAKKKSSLPTQLKKIAP